jgi:hypothetical protein
MWIQADYKKPATKLKIVAKAAPPITKEEVRLH